jgi:hypothetical protein
VCVSERGGEGTRGEIGHEPSDRALYQNMKPQTAFIPGLLKQKIEGHEPSGSIVFKPLHIPSTLHDSLLIC